ncbi:uncharacterized protein LOC126987610 isoform X1 [Eriocheir sinensis]|uniref:uncharacterized protein LOC126987610 isoform X1 n=1 Tax=Eriocheir sinensis TaxID=95602 RepID=UPI0021CA8394|nr:uncharacterized protein LOC126987610 isoform X1 [Eriocheir sinensis]
MSFFQQLLLLTVFLTPHALHSSSPSSSPACPSLQPAIHVTIFHTLDDIQLVTSTFPSTETIFSTKEINITTHQGQEILITEETPTTAYVTSTVLQRVTVDIPQVFTKMMPFPVTTTVVHIVTSTSTTQAELSIARTMTVNKLAHQELYQRTPLTITGVKMIPTCTSTVTVTARPRGGVTSTVDVLLKSTATTTLYKLYATSTSTTTLTVTRGSRVEQRCVTRW